MAKLMEPLENTHRVGHHFIEKNTDKKAPILLKILKDFLEYVMCEEIIQEREHREVDEVECSKNTEISLFSFMKKCHAATMMNMTRHDFPSRR
ncbi:hypothetical protein CHS0354_025932 [Potamilus streckersoni]|uniref:Uncharacterized protein n=1 Tax=Potamilus streckersoni TaxID=2493646 RepID=A0AAE0T4A6_9BIVA|nr:hypothetical protein CHS0354_025932 [Potamilus streckersoni]